MERDTASAYGPDVRPRADHHHIDSGAYQPGALGLGTVRAKTHWRWIGFDSRADADFFQISTAAKNTVTRLRITDYGLR